MTNLLLLLFWFQTLDLPRIGCVLGVDGQFRLLFGVRGNFLLGQPETCSTETDKFNPSGKILAVSRTTAGELLVLKRGWLYTIVEKRVVSRETVPEANSAVLSPDKAMLLERDDGVYFRLPNGEETKLDLDPPGPLRRIAADWAQCGGFALERRGTRVDIYVLPGARP